jgi:hypothetical protein
MSNQAAEIAMIIAHYAHRLPADYDMAIIRQRAKERGPLWDSVPDLIFKAFLLRQKGQNGASANNYSSLYLWGNGDAFRDFLVSGRYGFVTESFGRAAISTWFAFDARVGKATLPRHVYKQDVSLAIDADLEAAFARETERNRKISMQDGTVAVVAGVDPKTWNMTRVVLSANPPAERHEDMVVYEVLHLAKPHLASLPVASFPRAMSDD